MREDPGKGKVFFVSTTKEVRVGVGFVTGRKSFQNVLRTYVYTWEESGLIQSEKIHLTLLVAYDLEYTNTKSTDYINIRPELLDLFDGTCFIGNSAVQKEIDYLSGEKVIDEQDARLLFEGGYAAKRNTVLHAAIKHNLDYLLFIDDDEYPMAVTKTRSTAIWGGQHVLATHLRHIKQADITNGYHCGYISPVPHIEFNDALTQTDFHSFIEAISNDIINWDNIMKVMNNGGVTYADTDVLVGNQAKEVEEVNHAKFISGANLCINLVDPGRVMPFYNPPGARGEDTFLSTCLSERKVMRVPCYTFHDGFSAYNHLLDGVLPINLEAIKADSKQITDRFYHACIGWIRYKPLLLYITQRKRYKEEIKKMKRQLSYTLPKISSYFGKPEFMRIYAELETYHENVERHYIKYLATLHAWEKVRIHYARHGVPGFDSPRD